MVRFSSLLGASSSGDSKGCLELSGRPPFLAFVSFPFSPMPSQIPELTYDTHAGNHIASLDRSVVGEEVLQGGRLAKSA